MNAPLFALGGGVSVTHAPKNLYDVGGWYEHAGKLGTFSVNLNGL